MSFDVTATSGIASAVWDMGDATTSTQLSFSHKYSTAGIKSIKVTVSLMGGGTCVATKNVTVYELPKFKITKKASSNYCLWQNNVCLVDSSTGGDTGVTLIKRIIVWDDGNQDTTSSPQIGDNICHKYANSGTYKVTIELTNSKNCKLISEIEIIILKDLVPKPWVYSIDNESLRFCDSARTEFTDVITGDTSSLITRIYDWGDGSPKITTRSKHINHFYKKSGKYRVSLSYVQKNGCETKYDTIIDVVIYSIAFNLSKNAYKQCMGNVFRIQQTDLLLGAWYFWYLDDKSQDYGVDMKYVDLTPEPGIHKVSLEMYNYGCVKKFKYDTIEVIGYSVNVIVLNSNQCDNKDTVYFKTKVKQYGTGKLLYFWDFGDDKAPLCTTSREKGIDVNSNCNYSTDSLGKHFYVNPTCRTYTLTVKDTITGCASSTYMGGVNVMRPDTLKFNYTSSRLCIGNKVDYYIHFSHNLCSSVNARVNVDSTCDKDRWSIRMVTDYPYTAPCDKDGWVTVGFALEFGSRIIYRGFNDTADFYVDSSRICLDTVWKHKWFQLSKDPLAKIVPPIFCLNYLTKPEIIDSIQPKIAYTTWTWGDNSKSDTIIQNKGDTIIPRVGHTYKRPGNYVMRYYIENEKGCYSDYLQKIIIGFKMSVNFDSVICPGAMVMLKDSMCYLDSSLLYPNPIMPSKNYWHIAQRKLENREIFRWDFADGRGFATDTANPVISFPKIGNFKVRLAAKDSFNCWDTLSTTVNVGGVHAGIRTLFKRLICDGILQLYDSSFSDYKPPTDSITKYYWEFGDGGNPSYIQNPVHYYSTFGNYTVFQKVENSRGCTDTAYINISVEGPVADFDIIGDSVGCAPFTAKFKNKSIKTRDYIWYFGDPLKTKLSTNQDTNVSFTYTQPGIYYIYLFGSDSVKNPNAGNAIYYCTTLFPDTALINHPVRKIEVLPAPKADFSVNFIQCKNKPIVVQSKSDTMYTLHRWKIADVDSVETPNKTASLLAKDTGTFRIFYSPWYPPKAPSFRSCSDTLSKLVRVTEIKAAFTLDEDSTSCPVYTFTNNTKNAKSFSWNLGDSLAGDAKNIRSEKQLSYQYITRKGLFKPCLFVENSDGCRDTLCTSINVDFAIKLVIPNVFTPGNNDHKNDAFDILTEGLDEYKLSIFNRWGQKLFETDKDGVGDDGYNWRGRPNVVSDLYPDGTYFYILNYKIKCEDKAKEAHGIVTLIGPKE